MNPKLLSIVVPVLNEETNIAPFHARLSPVLEELQRENVSAEVLFVDDGSTDTTFEAIARLARADARVKCLRFSRNFGSHAAISAGFRATRGDCAVMISVDLQDPPELIAQLVRKWREGPHVVWAVRQDREETLVSKMFSSAFYFVFRKVALKNYPKTGMDFGLFDRQVLDALKEMRELNHFLTGMIVWLGFNQAHLHYSRGQRHSGASKWNFGKRLKAAIDAIASFSSFPVRLISYTGWAISVISFCYAATVVFIQTFLHPLTAGFPALMVTLLFLGGVQLIMLGILGEYLWRVNEQVINRPQYVLMETLGLGNEGLPATRTR